MGDGGRFDRKRVYADQIEATLVPGERLLALAAAMYHPGSEDWGDPPERLFSGTSLEEFIWGGSNSWLDQRVEWFVAGRTLKGHRGSFAEAFAEALARPGCDLILTDRRLLVVGELSKAEAARIDCSAELGMIAEIRRKPRMVVRGQVWISYRDGSGLAIWMGLARAAPAKRFIDAWRSLPPGGRLAG